MKVRELIALLESLPMDARVLMEEDVPDQFYELSNHGVQLRTVGLNHRGNMLIARQDGDEVAVIIGSD